jgi:hypothetical protein
MLSIKMKTIKVVDYRTHREKNVRILKHALGETRGENRSWTQEKKKMGKLAAPKGLQMST